MSQTSRAERIALNESRFREINDRLNRDLAQLRQAPEQLEFVCECGRLDCRNQIALRRAEYERVRADPMLFAITPGHESPDTEDVVDRTDRFSTVRKRPAVEDIAKSTDPRRAGRPPTGHRRA